MQGLYVYFVYFFRKIDCLRQHIQYVGIVDDGVEVQFGAFSVFKPFLCYLVSANIVSPNFLWYILVIVLFNALKYSSRRFSIDRFFCMLVGALNLITEIYKLTKMYSEGIRNKKSVPIISLNSNSRLLLPQMAQLRNTRDEGTPYHGAPSHTVRSQFEFCFGRSYSELNFQSNRYESNR